jgi:predicted RNA-binding Zn-ribbon protein involved in translation (DUF1610 family)
MIFNGKEYKGIYKVVDTITYDEQSDYLKQEIIIPIGFGDKLENTKQKMNELGLALIPYCFKCKEPIEINYDIMQWICPKCGRIWRKEGGSK